MEYNASRLSLLCSVFIMHLTVSDVSAIEGWKSEWKTMSEIIRLSRGLVAPSTTHFPFVLVNIIFINPKFSCNIYRRITIQHGHE